MTEFDNIVKAPFNIFQGVDRFVVCHTSLVTIVFHDESINYDFDPSVHGEELAWFGLAHSLLKDKIAKKVTIFKPKNDSE